MSDLPAESRIHPQLFGTLHFAVPDAGDLLEDMTNKGPNDEL